MREFNAPPLVCTVASECSGAHTHARHSATRDFPELRVYSRSPLGLVNLGLRFGRFGMRYLEVACVSLTIHP